MYQIDEENRPSRSSFHLAGIVPVDGEALDFKMPWHDCMMPIAPNYTMIERAILECAWAGCETIWVVCPPTIMPLLKHKVGNFVYEPVKSYWLEDHPSLGKIQAFERIPIFYVSTLEKHIGKRDSLGFSILQGAYHAYYIGYKMSKWLLPNLYYVAFPYGIYHPKQLKKHRMAMMHEKNFLLTSKDGKTIKDGEYLGFTFTRSQFKQFRDIVKTKKPGPNPKIYTLDDIYGGDTINEYEPIPILNYANAGSWKGYEKFISSGQSKHYTENSIKRYFKDFKHTLIGVADDEFEEELKETENGNV